ncbi:hypothetical protein B0H16DRAFT_1318601 [Mycena metata]|uniref:Uncharacterized protein n=1 Tax=Mycena metata TaxID=1033252 RepID=A0AAD7N7Y8_9AGAR|nr:hypothetical protein B0H16DRAFT_1318601 [Mycena metata]
MVIQPIPSLLKPTVSAKKTLHTPVTARPTETLPARDVFHEIQTAIRPLMAHVETREQVDDLLRNLDGIRQQNDEQRHRETIHDPPVVRHTGRPRTQRLTGANERRAMGGGGSGAKKRRVEDDHENVEPERITKKPCRRCGLCRKEGHNRATCPLLSL